MSNHAPKWASRSKYFPHYVLIAAQHSERAHGVPACVTLAQWALESAYGKSLSGKNNPFGIKAGPGVPGTVRQTWEVYNGRRVVVAAKFRDFASLEDAFKFHGRMLMNPRGYYRAAIPYRDDWKGYIRRIAPIYATDPAYADKLIGIIEWFRLFDFNLPKAGK